MKVLLPALLISLLSCPTLAQNKPDEIKILAGRPLAQKKTVDPKIVAGRDVYVTCLDSKHAAGRAKRMDYKQFQKFLEAACKPEAEALYAIVLEWSKARNLNSSESGHDRIAGLYVAAVLMPHVLQHASGVGDEPVTVMASRRSCSAS